MLHSPLGSRGTQITSPLGVNGGAGAWYSGAYAAHDAKGAASYAASLLDLTGNGRHSSTGLLPGWANGVGWMFNGTTGQYILTTVIPAVDQTWSMFVKFNSASVTGASDPCGMARTVGGSSRFHLDNYNGGAHAHANGSLASLLVHAAALSSGMLGFAGSTAYVNGVSDGTMTLGGGTGAALALYIGARNLNNTRSPLFTGTITSWVIYDYTVQPTDVSALYMTMP